MAEQSWLAPTLFCHRRNDIEQQKTGAQNLSLQIEQESKHGVKPYRSFYEAQIVCCRDEHPVVEELS